MDASRKFANCSISLGRSCQRPLDNGGDALDFLALIALRTIIDERSQVRHKVRDAVEPIAVCPKGSRIRRHLLQGIDSICENARAGIPTAELDRLLDYGDVIHPAQCLNEGQTVDLTKGEQHWHILQR